MTSGASQDVDGTGRGQARSSGRTATLLALDEMLAERENQAALKRALEQALHKDPFRFFRTVVLPLLPKDAKLTVPFDGIVEWKSLVEAFPLEEGAPPGADLGPGTSNSEP